jgi:2-(1,2-epoxy-1,2-dihydrophenyl)acetyl-CoA isomerase
MSEDLIETVAGGVATLRMNRPDSANALSMAIFDRFLEALPRLGRDPAVGVIVITGAGRAFCAGGDVKSMKGRSQELTYEQRVDELQRKHGVLLALDASPKVTISAINGSAAGAGLSLALACDLRIAARGARFATSFANIGFAGDFGGTFFATRLIGAMRAQELYLLNRKFDADEACRIGLLTKVVDDADFAGEVEALARQIADGPRLAYRYMKRNFQVAQSGSLADVLASEAMNQIRLTSTDDHVEALQAFRDKRAPKFKGA